MSVCNVLPAALLNRPMRSSALVTVSQEAVEMSDNTTMKQERKQSMRMLEEKRWEVRRRRGQALRAMEKKVDGWFEVVL